MTPLLSIHVNLHEAPTMLLVRYWPGHPCALRNVISPVYAGACTTGDTCGRWV